LAALGANLLALHVLIRIGLQDHKTAAQSIAIIVVTPLNFIGNKLWSFRLR
jgi:putative flippase GtrA